MTIRKNQEKIDKVNFEIFPVYIADVLKKMHKMQAESLEDYSLSAIHAPYMTTLAAHAEGLTMAELSKILKLDKANTSRAMNELLDKGFAEKAEDKKKKSVLRLTESGLAAAAALTERMTAFIGEALSPLDGFEKRRLYKLLYKLASKDV